MVAPTAAVLLLIAAGAAAHRPLGGGRPVPTLPSWPLLMIVGAGLVAAAALVVTALWPGSHQRGLGLGIKLPPRPGLLVRALGILVPLTVVSLVLVAATQRGAHNRPPAPVARIPSVRGVGHHGGGANAAAAVATGMAIGALGLAVLAARSRRGRSRNPDRARGIAAAGAQDALAALAVPSDPRAAVLVAYAKMQAALAQAGFGRRVSEAPREYLDRLSTGLGIPRGPSGRLTALFERARFSTHPVDESMRDDAIASLQSIRDGLDVDGPPAPPS